MTTLPGAAARPSYGASSRGVIHALRLGVARRRLDWVLLGAVLLLLVLGSVLVWSASRAELLARGAGSTGLLQRHLLNLAVGLLLCAAVSRFGARSVRFAAPLLYGVGVLGLVAVLAVGTEKNGAKAWIELPGGFSLQPSEFAKVAVIVLLAMLLAEKREEALGGPRLRDVLVALVLAVVPIGLVLLQNDLGTALVFAAVTFGMLAASGARAWLLTALVLGAAAAAALVVATGQLDDYQLRRLTSFVDPTADPRGAGYNSQQARIAIGSGGWTGAGLFAGPQTQGRFVPEQQTDFIFTVAGEELGFLGAFAILLLLGVILWRALHIGLASPDLYGRLVAAGVVCWFTFQSFQNIGMCLGIMPVTGLPLPFVSYGGSSMFASLVAVGLLQNLHRDRDA